jgi:hypothetical protein
MAVVMLTGAAVVLPVAAGLPAMNARAPEPIVVNQTEYIDTSVTAMEEAMARKDWDAMQKHAAEAASAANSLERMGATAPTLASLHEQAKVDDLRVQLKTSRESLQDAQMAIFSKDASRLEAAMRKFHAAYGSVRSAAKPAG